ncbi:hypothetical protein SAMN05660772_02082 [Pasteurella testudinis DSM 23072]|uniref:Uncharacterized protein n=1 Tax=Pasteurella testudinis DSM 23072 TaxID=1122938 RepID=A0A1W1UMK6_9PAST|nr:hypothetical protein [Pasteurella testudinis]SMB82368.1 hypothetical protein SAMN05660772_02082 [Pasteurella testudinis DSM 23072]SUB52232.1 Uncharacterised protein [Pasteurella testudinis]
MKKFLLLPFIVLFSITAQAALKAQQPETTIEVPFTKNANGVVQFDSIKAVFEETSGEYFEDDRTLKIISQSPLKVQAFNLFPDRATAEFAEGVIESHFIFHVYRTFIHSDVDSIDLSITPIYAESRKPFGATIQAKITRQKALRILQQFSNARSFDDLISLDPNAEYTFVGLSPSDLFMSLATGKQHKQVLSALINK